MNVEAIEKRLRVLAIDLDGVLANKGEPIQENIDRVNKLFDSPDNLIIIYTARCEAIREETTELLTQLGVKYHSLVMEKLRATYYVDDRSITLPELTEGL